MKNHLLRIFLVIALLSSMFTKTEAAPSITLESVEAYNTNENDDFVIHLKTNGIHIAIKQELAKDVKIELVDATGKVVLTQEIGSYANFFLSMHGFAKGNYQVKLVGKDLNSELPLVW